MLSYRKFLDSKTLYYDEIDFTIINLAWEHVRLHVTLPYVIHLVGTNGKGSTGRFLAHYFHKIKKSVVHYSSPHIMDFNERIWVDGENCNDELLEETHQDLLKIIPKKIIEKLTYFEYTTLLALKISSNHDYIVLEAGLGGEFDATNIVKNDLSLITTIDFDHQSFLGNTIEEIAGTKMRSVDNVMILGYQLHAGVEKVAYEIKKNAYFNQQKRIEIKNFNLPIINLEELNFPKYLKHNLRLAISALRYLKYEVNIKNFEDVKLQGRCQQIKENITIDVGHNPLAASVILEEFLQREKKVILVYNSMKDKDYVDVLTILKPIIKKVQIIDIDDIRAVEKDELTNTCENLDIECEEFNHVFNTEMYLVFGSFLVVESFLNYMKSCEINEK